MRPAPLDWGRSASEPETVHVVGGDPEARTAAAIMLGRSGVRATLHEGAAGFLAAAPELPPGCVLLDLEATGTEGLDLLRRLHERFDPHLVIVVTGRDDVETAVSALKLGAVDLLLKPLDAERLLRAVKGCAASVRGLAELRVFQRKLVNLSVRERQVFDLFVDGHLNKVIGEKLGISPRTVEIHRARVMAKLDVGSFAQLIRFAVRAGVA